MQYDKFEQLVKKLAKLAKLAFKHMTKIIISASAVLAIVISLLATRGIIVGAESCPRTVTYGEELGYKADAFLSGVTYEYSEQSSNKWSPVAPVLPGTYRVRAVAKATFGYRYAEPETFTIVPKEIDVAVSSKSMTYGENPGVSADTAYEDVISCSEFIFNDDLTKITPDPKKIYVHDKDGNDVSRGYILNAKETDFVTNKRPITIESTDIEIVYDGMEHKDAKYKVSRGTLAKGDTLSVSFVSGITDVGEIEGVFEYRITNKSGADVTDFYLVDAFYGTIKVLPRPIKIKTESGSFVYNGLYNGVNAYKLDGKLVDGHSLIDSNWATLADVGEIDNTFTAKFTDKDGINVTSNYEVTFVPGKLKVTPRPLKVTTPSETRVYSSEWWSNAGVSVEGLVSGDVYRVVEFTEAIWVGKVDNEVKIAITSSGRGVDVTGNYDITYDEGVLTVTKRPIHIITESGKFVYDGYDHGSDFNSIVIAGEYGIGVNERVIVHSPEIIEATTGIPNKQWIEIVFEARGQIKDTIDNYDVTYEYGTIVVEKRDVHVTTGSITDYYDGKPLATTDYTASGISNIHDFIIKSSTQLTNAGSVQNKFTQYDIVNESGVSVLHNYKVSFSYGTITVMKRPVIISTASAERVYDGTPLRAQSWVVCEDSLFELVEGDIVVSPTPSGYQIDVGSSLNSYSGTIRINDKSGTNVTANYEIIAREGTLTVTPRPIIVCTEGLDIVYDDVARNLKNVWADTSGGGYGLCSGHTFKVLTHSEWRDVVDGELNVLGVAVTNGTKDVTSNYELTYEYGLVIIRPRPITVTTNGFEYIYDDQYHSDKKLNISGEYGLCTGHTFSDIVAPRFRDVVKDAKNKVTFTIKRGSTDVTHNYEIVDNYGTVNIKPRPITVTTNSINRVYDDKVYSDSYLLLSGTYGLCKGHSLTDIEAPKFRDVIKNTVNSVKFVIARQNGEDVTSNYDITYKYGEVNILPRSITVVTNGFNRVYDDKYHSDDKVTISGAYGLCKGHTTSADAQSFRDVVKDVENKVKLTIYRDNGDDVTSNYEITYKYGKVTISPRPITVETNSFYGEYDGLSHGGIVTVREGAYGLCTGHDIRIILAPEFKNVVDNAENVIDFIIKAGDRDVTKNYDITVINGRITIYKRVVKITTESKSWPYDGKLHEHPKYSVDKGYSFVDTHTVSVKKAAGITEVGEKPNELLLAVLDESKSDVSSNYDIIISTYGTLTITKAEITPPDEDEDYRDIVIGGPIIGGGGGGGAVAYYIESDTSGNVYLKLYSYGDFTGSGWRTADDYDKLLLDYASAYYLTTLALENNGEAVSFMKITAKNGTYVLPYYASDKDADVQKSDVTVSGDASEEYCVYYYSWDGYPDKGLPVTLKQFEKAYRDHVYSTYLNIDADTLTFMQGIIKSQGFELNDPDVVKKIADYVSGIATNTSDYDKELDKSKNVAIAFLGKYKEGTCQHFASAATMLYRAMGIPARYTVGYATEVEAGKTAKVTELMAHAWVEVYLDGIGWVRVEVTPVSADGGDDPLPGPVPGLGDGEDGEDEDDGLIDGGGDIGLPPPGQGGAPVVVYTLVGSTSGRIYLKFKSFGDYAGTRWGEANEYGSLLLDGSSAYYLTSLALSKNGAPESFVSITSKYDQYVLPYYALSSGAYVQKSDAVINGDAGATYVIGYLTFEGYDIGEVPSSVEEFEAAYREFVYDNYLKIDTETLAYMKGIIAKEGFDISSPTVIDDIAEYIKGAATYSLGYDRALDKSANIAIAFLETYKSGVCQHYATAATLMYRALGIPARYTIGYVGETKEGEETLVTSAEEHAWVEVYIDGTGWVMVEVTGAYDGSEPTDATITVTPIFQYKEYDGTPLYAKDLIDETDPVLAELLASGYTYKVKVGGSQTGVGASRSYIESFTLYDPDGNDVTDRYEIIYEEGELRIGGGTVEIYLHEKRYEYNGSAYSYENDDYVIVSASQGIRFVVNSINISMTNVGAISSNEINNNLRTYIDYSIYAGESDADVSEYYIVKVVDYNGGGSYIPFEIVPREIVIATGSATKADDGKPLTEDSYYVSQGTLVDGHELYVEVIGEALSKGTVFNLVNKEKTALYDKDGNDVTNNYSFEFSPGSLTIT